jgi:hypothetical protein
MRQETKHFQAQEFEEKSSLAVQQLTNSPVKDRAVAAGAQHVLVQGSLAALTLCPQLACDTTKTPHTVV